ncbi:cupin domain-containing protein [Aldersonia sp. NBC_00410]|uniref:cupin domain-containing protein n=1 Tax=Aldersonia sp. NBC_00410 TaxID=2975954 RepID=UPI002257A174|nr:cupin domain-containing protein [Aldersonia sp. NBC_00410]MCX5043587.1 cupin domain-containing protein [Aldersonia sp. NBC_00410]
MLDRVVSVDAQTFAREFWGRAPLLSRADELPRDFDDLLSSDAVDELVAERGVRAPFLRMARNGDVLDRGCFTDSGGFGAEMPDQVDSARVLAEFAAGATIVLQGLHRLWPPIIEFVRSAVDEIGHPTQTNAYVTPASNRGFEPHYDVHDVFVLQVAGSKHWRVHAPVHADPLPNQPWTQHRAAIAARSAEEPAIDTELAPGDALYLPRGWIHSADALGTTSIHLTVGVGPFTRYDIVHRVLSALAEQPELRGSLPLGLDLADRDAVSAEVRKTLPAILAALRSLPGDAAIADSIGNRFAELTRPAAVRPLATVESIGNLTDTATVHWRRGLLGSLESNGGAHVDLRLPGKTITFPVACLPALESIATRRPVTAATLPGLSSADGLVLLRRLLREAVVEVA